MNTLQARVMGFIYQFFSETTIHGLCHITKNKPLVFRLLWFAVFLMGLSATGYWHYNTIKLYLSKPTSTEFNIKKSDYMLLPRIMICTRNQFNGTTIKEMNISEDLISVLHYDKHSQGVKSLTPDFPDIRKLLNQTFSEYQSLKKMLRARYHQEILDHLFPKCEDIVLECKDTLLGVPQSCCSEAIMYDLFHQPCVLLPQYEVSTQLDAGILFLLKYPNQSELSPGPNSDIVEDHNIFILRDDTLVDFDIGGTAARGKHTHIVIETVLHTSVNKPPDFLCTDKKNYSDVGCTFDCMVAQHSSAGKMETQNMSQLEYADCPAELITGRKIGNAVESCDPWQHYEYNQKVVEDNSSGLDMYVQMNKCDKQCLPRCEQHRHTSRYLSISDFSIDVLNKLWKDPTKTKSIMETRGILVVSGKAETQLIHQKFSLTPTTLIGNLGGSLGLFLGGSLASLVHVIIFIVENAIGKKKKTDENKVFHRKRETKRAGGKGQTMGLEADDGRKFGKICQCTGKNAMG